MNPKHIRLRYQYMCEEVVSGEITLEHIPTYQQLADMITKELSTNRFADLMYKVVNIGLDSDQKCREN